MKPWQNTEEAEEPESDPSLPDSNAQDVEKAPTESDPLLPDSKYQDVQKSLSKKRGSGAGSSTDRGVSSSDQRGLQKLGMFRCLTNLRQVFGLRFLLMTSAVQHMLKGFVMSLADKARPFLYKSLNVPATQVQIFDSVASIGWVLKPVLGITSDLLPIGGKNKAPYMILTSIFGAGAFLYVGVTPKASLTVVAIVICHTFQDLQLSTCDLLSEAKYAEKIQQNPAHGPDMVSFVWIGIRLAAVVAFALSTPMIDASPQLPYLVCAIPALFIIAPLAFGYMDEQTQTAVDIAETRKRFFEQSETSILCAVMLFATIALSVCGILTTDPWINCGVGLIVFAVVLVSFSVLLAPTIAKFTAFSLIQTSLGISISGATFYFYTDTAAQYPEGPHFSTFFYNFVMGSGGAFMSVVGLMTYSRFLSHWSYRSVLVAVNCAASFLSLLDIMMFTRFNATIGIPDHVFIIGNGGLETMISEMQWMPQVVMMSYMCPQGMEATMFALLAGCHNLGISVAGNFGALMLHLLHCNPQGVANEGHQFENLWVASLVSTVLPLAVVLFLFKLIPDRQQDENLLTGNSVTSGSLWQQWRSRAVQAQGNEQRNEQVNDEL